MKILWITNNVFPEAESILNRKASLPGSGGWMSSLANEIKDKLELFVAAPSSKVEETTVVDCGNVRHYIFPMGKGNCSYNKEYESIWKDINLEVAPDVVHIHGTEYSHGLAFLKACGSNNVVVSIQGVMDEIAKHYNDGLSKWEIITNLTIHDILMSSLFQDKRRAHQRAISEPQILKKVDFVMGRTTFDHAYVMSVNPNVLYFHCGEILRETFYRGCWEYSRCIPHTIFVSSARYPLKGFHMLLHALPSVIREFPDVKVMVAGGTLRNTSGIREKLSLTGYQNILNKYIEKLNLKKHICFLGALSAKEMKEQLLRANLFLLPSSNENSSNALGEAQLLGVPCLASFVGGTPDMIHDLSCGELYNYFDVNVLAYKICEQFRDSDKFDNTKMIQIASDRHNKRNIVETVIDVYNHISEKNK